MTTDELVKMLLSPDMARSMNESLRQQIIEILQQREGNAFVQRLRGKSTKRKIDKHRLAACQESASDYEKARL